MATYFSHERQQRVIVALSVFLVAKVFLCKKKSLSLFCCLICCKLSEPSCKDLCWMGVRPRYLLWSQLMALKHTDGVRCNTTPIMSNVYTRMQELQICSSVLRSQPVFHLLLETLKREH
ncbi:hypothetical protein INR49_010913 [Caranx melampygus]|nr:hypothetical protein INR49_010913 [Caranx melampygus]